MAGTTADNIVTGKFFSVRVKLNLERNNPCAVAFLGAAVLGAVVVSLGVVAAALAVCGLDFVCK